MLNSAMARHIIARNEKVGRIGKTKDASIPDMHQKRILIDTIKNPAKGMFLGGPSFAEAKEILMKKFGYTEQAIKNLAKDFDPRGYKVKDQIIKGFMIYKSGTNQFTAKNEKGKQFEGTMEQINKQINDYWTKQDEDVMKQKVRDEMGKCKSCGDYKHIDEQGICDKCKKDWYVEGAHDSKIKVKDGWAKNAGTKDAKARSPRFRIKDDKLFRLKSMVKKMKDGQSYNMAVEYELFTYYNIPRSQARQIVERNSQELQKKEDANITIHNAAEMLIHKEGIKGFEKIYVTQGDSKTKDKSPHWRIKDDKASEEFVEDYKGFKIYRDMGRQYPVLIAYKNNSGYNLERNGVTASSLNQLKGDIDSYVKSSSDSKTKDAKNFMGERSFRTYEAWKRACKEINSNVQFEGDKDICQAKPGIGEWDGNEGIIYSKDSKTKDKILFPEAIIKVNEQRKKVTKPVVTESQEEAKEKLKAFILLQYPNAKILQITCDSDKDFAQFYKSKLDEAIDSDDKEGMKRWSQELIDHYTTDADSEVTIGKHDDVPDDQFDKDELAKGIKVEMEHTNDPEVAKSIARDHLFEIRDYYTRLLKMEAEAKR